MDGEQAERDTRSQEGVTHISNDVKKNQDCVTLTGAVLKQLREKKMDYFGLRSKG